MPRPPSFDDGDTDAPGYGARIIELDDDDGQDDTNPARGRSRFRGRGLINRSRSRIDPINPRQPHEEPPKIVEHGLMRATTVASYLNARHAFQCSMHPNLAREWFEIREQVWELRDVRGLYTVSNNKGGVGKTPLIGYLSAIHALCMDGPYLILLIDVNENTGSPAYRFGIRSEETLILPDFLEDQDRYSNYSELIRKIGFNRETRLGVMPNREFFEQEDYLRKRKLETGLIKALIAAASVYADPGNDALHYCNTVPASLADVLMFPAVARARRVGLHRRRPDNESFHRIGMISDKYRDEKRGPMLAERVEESHVVVLGAEQKRAEEYAQMLSRDPASIFLIPYDNHMTLQEPNCMSVMRLHLRTKVALARLLVANLQHPRNKLRERLYSEELQRRLEAKNSPPVDLSDPAASPA